MQAYVSRREPLKGGPAAIIEEPKATITREHMRSSSAAQENGRDLPGSEPAGIPAGSVYPAYPADPAESALGEEPDFEAEEPEFEAEESAEGPEGRPEIEDDLYCFERTQKYFHMLKIHPFLREVYYEYVAGRGCPEATSLDTLRCVFWELQAGLYPEEARNDNWSCPGACRTRAFREAVVAHKRAPCEICVAARADCGICAGKRPPCASCAVAVRTCEHHAADV